MGVGGLMPLEPFMWRAGRKGCPCYPSPNDWQGHVSRAGDQPGLGF